MMVMTIMETRFETAVLHVLGVNLFCVPTSCDILSPHVTGLEKSLLCRTSVRYPTYPQIESTCVLPTNFICDCEETCRGMRRLITTHSIQMGAV